MDKKYLTNVCLYVFVGIVAIFLILFVLYHLLGWGESSFSTRTAIRLTAEETVEGEGYLFRHETVLYGSEELRAYSTLGEGENVRKGGEVCALYSCGEDLPQALEEYDRAIALLTEADVKDDLSVITVKLKNLTASLRSESDAGNLKNLVAMLEELQTELNRRKRASGAVDSFGAEIKRLTAERAAILAKMGGAQKVYAPVSGNFYTRCDGYEELFDSEKLSEMNPASFLELTESRPAAAPEGEHAVGKIAEGSYWYFAMTVSLQESYKMVSGRTYTVKLSSGESLKMTLDQMKTDRETGEVLLVFGARTLPATPLKRCESISVVTDTYTGLMVPTAALRYVKNDEGEDQVGVYIREGNRIRFKKTVILCQQNGYYIVKETSSDLKDYKSYLALNDVVITSGKNLKVGYAE